MLINNVTCSFTHQMESTVEYTISQMYWIFFFCFIFLFWKGILTHPLKASSLS